MRQAPSASGGDPPPAERAETPPSAQGAPVGLVRLILAVSFGTAVASFAYEIGWIRLLSLVLGSATHAFELMLSAFLLGLGLGAVLVRPLADQSPTPLRFLGAVQWTMGLMALATLPFYGWVFDAMGYLVTVLPARDGGYVMFNLSRYALALAVMLPATLLAGTTLPLLTATLLRAGAGEGAIGRVVGLNTLGSVVGATGAGLVLLPLMGVKGLLVGGAALDLALGVWLLAVWAGRPRRSIPWVLTGVGAAACALVGWGVHLDQAVLTSGVFRYGRVPAGDSRRILFYRDGRTATVGVHWRADNELVVLTTNGKPDASLGPRWFDPQRGAGDDIPLAAEHDATTQVLAPLVALAFAPDARRIANIGHGSGMSGTTLLSGRSVEDLTTVEIEPAMVDGSLSFLPANRRVFEDPRSRFVFDDARAYLSYGAGPFDLVFAEPSNPWVRGTSSLFTEEFYGQVRRHMAASGVLAQWIQLYEIDDGLVLSVIAALDAHFGSYRGYLVGDRDLLLIASPGGDLPDPDWRVFELPAAREILAGVPPFRPGHLDPLLLFDHTSIAPALRGVTANSDFHPVLDDGAERMRFKQVRAEGFLGLGQGRVDLRRILAGLSAPPDSTLAPAPAKGLAPSVRRSLSAWLGRAERARGGIAPETYPEWQPALTRLRDYYAETSGVRPPEDWKAWTARFAQVEADLHAGTAGWVDTTFYSATLRYLDAAGAPTRARAAVGVLHGIGAWDFEEAAQDAELLLPLASQGDHWLAPDVLSDAAVVADLELGRPERARATLEALAPLTGRAPGDLRQRLLEGWIREGGGPRRPPS